MSNNDDDDKIKKLLEDAHGAGALSAKSLATLDVVDVGAQIQAGLGCTIDDESSGIIVTSTTSLEPTSSIAQADAALQKFADAGMHLVRSTDPISSWPGIRL